jgi:3-deoxy-D-manno-octulosonic acid kinase
MRNFHVLLFISLMILCLYLNVNHIGINKKEINMARELERVIVRDKNTTYVVNPYFLNNDAINSDELKEYCNIENYQLKGKVIYVFTGRGETYLVTDKYNHRIVIRHYWRGGFIGKFLKDKFCRFFYSSKRAMHEYDLLLTMRKMGLSVPRPIVARITKIGFFLKNDIITQEIPGAKNIAKILCERKLTDAEICKIGEAIGKMFTAGVYHSDLNINNLLFDGAGNAWIVDFDKCFLKPITKKLYKEMLDRLERSFAKEISIRPTMQWSTENFEKLTSSINSSFKDNY